MTFLSRVRRGDRTLGMSYWIYWLIGNNVLFGLIIAVFALTLFSDPRRAIITSPIMLWILLFVGAILIFVVMPFYCISTSIGVIRSAARYLALEKRPLMWIAMARLAQLHALTGFVAAFLPILAVITLFDSPSPHALLPSSG